MFVTSENPPTPRSLAFELKCLNLVLNLKEHRDEDASRNIEEELNNAMLRNAKKGSRNTPATAPGLIPVKGYSDGMSSLERLVRHTVALLNTMRWFDDPESFLAVELGVLPIRVYYP